MSHHLVQSSTPCIVLGIILCITGCSNDHKQESRQIATELAEELIEQQMEKKPDSTSKTDNTRSREIQAELAEAGLTADEVRMMLDSLQQQLTAAQQKDTVVIEKK